jgi:hypothetical protein
MASLLFLLFLLFGQSMSGSPSRAWCRQDSSADAGGFTVHFNVSSMCPRQQGRHNCDRPYNLFHNDLVLEARHAFFSLWIASRGPIDGQGMSPVFCIEVSQIPLDCRTAEPAKPDPLAICGPTASFQRMRRRRPGPAGTRGRPCRQSTLARLR